MLSVMALDRQRLKIDLLYALQHIKNNSTKQFDGGDMQRTSIVRRCITVRISLFNCNNSRQTNAILAQKRSRLIQTNQTTTDTKMPLFSIFSSHFTGSKCGIIQSMKFHLLSEKRVSGYAPNEYDFKLIFKLICLRSRSIIEIAKISAKCFHLNLGQ